MVVYGEQYRDRPPRVLLCNQDDVVSTDPCSYTAPRQGSSLSNATAFHTLFLRPLMNRSIILDAPNSKHYSGVVVASRAGEDRSRRLLAWCLRGLHGQSTRAIQQGDAMPYGCCQPRQSQTISFVLRTCSPSWCPNRKLNLLMVFILTLLGPSGFLALFINLLDIIDDFTHMTSPRRSIGVSRQPSRGTLLGPSSRKA